MIEVIGILGMLLLSFAAFPQFIEALYNENAALNLNWGYLYCWLIGVIMMTIYTHLIAGNIYPIHLQITNIISIIFSSGLITLKYIYSRKNDLKKN